MKIERFADRAALDAALASRLAAAIEQGGAIMLSGGNTPKPAYAQLAARAWQLAKKLTVLYSDERYVAPSSHASNFHASTPLLSALGLPPERVIRVRTELALEAAASDYDSRLSELLAAEQAISLGVLGLGADGHTASLFTSDDLARSQDHLAISVQRPDAMQAVTVTPSFLSRVEKLMIVVPGRDKRAALEALLAQDSNLVAWRAVSSCPDVEVWCEASGA